MRIYIDVASSPDKEELVAEAFIDNLQWCELSQEAGRPILTFFDSASFPIFSMDFDTTIAVLNHMKDYFEDGRCAEQRPEWHSLD